MRLTIAMLLAVTLIACSDPLATGPLSTGIWGGQGIRLEVTGAGAEAEFDCAAGRVDMPLNAIDGRFDALGTYTLGRGGPLIEDEVPDTRSARYVGHVRGKVMDLEVRVDGFTTAKPLVFALERDNSGILRHCF